MNYFRKAKVKMNHALPRFHFTICFCFSLSLQNILFSFIPYLFLMFISSTGHFNFSSVNFHSSSPTKESFYCLFSNGQFTSSHFHIPITGTEMDVCPTLKFDYPTNFPAICFQFRVWFPSQAEPAVPVSYSSFATSHRCRK